METTCSAIHDRLQRILEKRDRLYPIRDPENDRETHQCLNEYVEYLENSSDITNWNPEEAVLQQALMMKEEAVFLCGPMKSGTTLLLELLDYHSDLNVLPGDAWFFVRFIEKVKDEVFNGDEWARHWLKRFINPTGQKPFWLFGEGEIDYISCLRYIKYWLNNLPGEPRRPVLAAVLSYLCANPKSSAKALKWVEKTPGNELYAEQLCSHFPKAKFIHMIRDPRENFASIKRLYFSRGWKWAPRSMARSLVESYRVANENRHKFGEDRYLVVRYEDLVENSTEVMQNIASFLAIPWQDSLIVPTINGIHATANSMYRDRLVVGAIRKNDKSRWRKELSVFEQAIILQVKGEAENFGYVWDMSMADCYKKILFCWALQTKFWKST